jgi:NAD(P)-dependent dehydrogenase (short-subunit alcohol dehydrogenase family)
MKTIAVTGAARGLGLALARELAEAGPAEHRVILTARNSADAIRAAHDLHAQGLTAVEPYTLPLDVSNAQDAARFGRYTKTSFGGIDILINNAAVCERGWNERVVRHTFKVNVLGPLVLMHTVLQGMLHRRRGHIVNISSGDGELVYLNPSLQDDLAGASSARHVLRTLVRASPPREAFGTAPAHSETPAYAISKAALNAMTRVTAAGIREYGDVRVSAVCPGNVLTRMCTEEHELEDAVSAAEAAADVARLAMAGLDSTCAFPNGQFWRRGNLIPY